MLEVNQCTALLFGKLLIAISLEMRRLELLTSAVQGHALPSELHPLSHTVGLVGLEPTTSPLSEERSNRLSYRPSSMLFQVCLHKLAFAIDLGF